MQDIRALSNFLAAAGKKFQTHRSNIAQAIYQALVSDLILRQSPVVEAAPVDVSLSSFLQDGPSFHNLFNSQRSLSKRSTFKFNRDAAIIEWRSLVTP